MGGEKEQEVACARLLCGHHTSGAPLQEAGGVHEVHERDDWAAVRGLSPLVHLFSNGLLTPPEQELCTGFLREPPCKWTAASRHHWMPSTCGVVPHKVQGGFGLAAQSMKADGDPPEV